MKCAGCGSDFAPEDRIEISTDLLPASMGAFAPLVKKLFEPHISRVVAHRCSRQECGGVVSVLYLPPGPPAPQGVQTPS